MHLYKWEHAFGAHQAVRKIGLARALVVGANPSYVHASASIEQTSTRIAAPQKFYGTTSRLAEAVSTETDTYVSFPASWSEIVLKMG